VLYVSNNRIKDWGELDRLAGLEKLEDVLLVGGRVGGRAGRANLLAQKRVWVLLVALPVGPAALFGVPVHAPVCWV
jgi:hypothetical protein